MTRNEDSNSALTEVMRLALKIGATGFGGPAAHIAMLRQEAVQKRSWIAESEYLDMIGVTNLIPGPNSTEMVMQIGRLRAGWRGMVAAGIAFILPAVLLSGLLAWMYVERGSSPTGQWILYGVKPVVAALLLQAVWGLGRVATHNPTDLIVVLASAALFLAGVNEIVILVGGSIGVMLLRKLWHAWRERAGGVVAFAPLGLLVNVSNSTVSSPDGYSNSQLFLIFLKVGALLWGSGYVLLAFLHSELVDQRGWLTNDQLIDAVAVGQLTPGPVFSAATFIGYLLGGVPGAIAATVGIFLPAFLLAGIVGNVLHLVRRHNSLRQYLDALNQVSLGLMAGVAIYLLRDSIVDWPAAAILAVATVCLIRYPLSSTLLLPAAALAGVAIGQFN